MRGRLLVVLIVPVLAASTASAAWHAAGAREPGTAHDIAAGRMFLDADALPGPTRIYFQAFQAAEGTTLNPNVGTAGTRLLPAGPVQHRAMLGLWKDCNGDGHVGLAESAILDYRSALLLDDTACPPGSMHHDGGWVSEMIGIGMVDPCEYAPEAVRASECGGLAPFHLNERVLYANGTMVWGDVGEPGAVPPAECPLAPPPGTTSGTGLLLAYLACQEGRRIETAILAAGVDPALLDQPFPVTPFGGGATPGVLEPGTGEPSATVWDCASPRETAVADPTGGSLDAVVLEDPSGGRLTGPQPAMPVVGTQTVFQDADGDASTPGTLTVPVSEGGDLLWVPAVSPTVHDPTASSWDAAEAALDGPRGDCDGRGAIHPYAPGPYVESGAPPVAEARKDRSSLAFTFYDGHRGLNERVDFALGPATPSDGGLLYLRHGRGGVGPLWSAQGAGVNEPQLVTRGSLAPTGATFWTYYATLGPDALAAGGILPSPSTAVYGAEACDGRDEGVHGGWVCDGALWWRDALGNDARPRYSQGEPYAPLPGQPYHLRDVDCYDGHVAADGVYASAAVLSERVC